MKKKRTQPPTGLNTDPAYMAKRGAAGAAKSPWRKGPALKTRNALKTFAENGPK